MSLCASAPRHGRACLFQWVCTSACLHTSVWKSPSDESGVLAEDESQFLLCSSIRSFCSPGTMDSSGVMVLKLSQELWSSGVDLSLDEFFSPPADEMLHRFSLCGDEMGGRRQGRGERERERGRQRRREWGEGEVGGEDHSH